MDYIAFYVKFLKKFLKPKKNMKVVFDCSNGTTGLVLSQLFKGQKKIDAKLINYRPDGRFPAHGPNPMERGALKDLKKKIKKEKADLGAIFDADGDRVFFVDDKARLVSADVCAASIGANFKGPVVLTPLSGYLVREIFKKEGKKIIESRVGHYFIKKAMKKVKAKFGAETSGHYYFNIQNTYYDSGVLAVIYFINAVSNLKENLSDWIDSLPRYYHSGELNFKVKNKKQLLHKIEQEFRKNARKISKLDGLKVEFDDYWFSIRPSQTEDLVRLNLEAKSKKTLKKALARIKKLI